MEGPAGVLRCPAPGTLVQRLTDQSQSGAGPLGYHIERPAPRLAPLSRAAAKHTTVVSKFSEKVRTNWPA